MSCLVSCPGQSNTFTYVCHSGKPKCLNENTLQAHLDHGDPCCGDDCCSNCAENDCTSGGTSPPTTSTTTPTTPPSINPTLPPTPSPTNLPTFRPTFPPTTPPPTLPPTPSPTNLPTSRLAFPPTTPPPTNKLSPPPWFAPTSAPTLPEGSTYSPSPKPSTKPSVTQNVLETNAQMNLTGVRKMDSEATVQWINITRWQITDTVMALESATDNIFVNLTVLSQVESVVIQARRVMSIFEMNRFVEPQTAQVVLIINVDVDIYLNSLNTTQNAGDYVSKSFSTEELQQIYLDLLMATGNPVFADVSAVSVSTTVTDPDGSIGSIKNNDNSGGIDSGILYIGLAIAGGFIFIIASALLVRRRRRKNKKSKESVTTGSSFLLQDLAANPEVGAKNANPYGNEIQINNEEVDPVSTLGEPTVYTNNIYVDPEEDEVSVLADPNGLYADHSVIDDQTIEPGFDYRNVYLTEESVMEGSSEVESTALFSHGIWEDARYEVEAPPGPLGLVLETGQGGIPIVTFVESSSVMKDIVSKGDRLLMIDGIYSATMTYAAVKRLISEKTSSTRRFVFAKSPPPTEETESGKFII